MPPIPISSCPSRIVHRPRPSSVYINARQPDAPPLSLPSMTSALQVPPPARVALTSVGFEGAPSTAPHQTALRAYDIATGTTDAPLPPTTTTQPRDTSDAVPANFFREVWLNIKITLGYAGADSESRAVRREVVNYIVFLVNAAASVCPPTSALPPRPHRRMQCFRLLPS